MPELCICSLMSSSKGNATIIHSENTHILVDCGISGKALEESLAAHGLRGEMLDAILVTHEHSDHIKGVGVVSRKFDLPIYATEGTWMALDGLAGKIPQEHKKTIATGESFLVGNIEVTSFKIPHDAAQPVGYVFECHGEKVSVATDIGIMTEDIFEEIKGSRAVLLESNYDLLMLEAGPYPYDLKCRIRGDRGHLSNEDAALTARDLVKCGTREIILGHISGENNYPELIYRTVKLCLESNDIKTGEDARLFVARRDGQVVEFCDFEQET